MNVKALTVAIASTPGAVERWITGTNKRDVLFLDWCEQQAALINNSMKRCTCGAALTVSYAQLKGSDNSRINTETVRHPEPLCANWMDDSNNPLEWSGWNR